jgi:formate dehydrogenase major subunit
VVVSPPFHHMFTGANVVTTEFSDWATGCPEYKVTAVEVTLARKLSSWQQHYLDTRKQTTRIAEQTIAAGR